MRSGVVRDSLVWQSADLLSLQIRVISIPCTDAVEAIQQPMDSQYQSSTISPHRRMFWLVQDNIAERDVPSVVLHLQENCQYQE